ncbi:GIY-YIG nuclease family protein [Microbacterium sp. NPDC055599]
MKASREIANARNESVAARRRRRSVPLPVAFGPDVVKIGLTRRLKSIDRVNELGDASVPFRFDVHALFFADDAVSIQAMLHQHFADRRINRVNMRREYFRATPTEVSRSTEGALRRAPRFQAGAGR